MSIQGIKEEVRKLSRSEQAELMHYMIELLATDDFELSEAWKAEIDASATSRSGRRRSLCGLSADSRAVGVS